MILLALAFGAVWLVAAIVVGCAVGKAIHGVNEDD